MQSLGYPFGQGILIHFSLAIYRQSIDFTGFSYPLSTYTYCFADVLEMTIEEAAAFFTEERYIKHKLSIMNELGLGYLKLGQNATTLSGGEAQRVKLAYELAKIKRGSRNLYILDEPTTGLHLSDIQKLLLSLGKLVDSGHTVIVIEHNLDVIKTADYLLDLGPEGGNGGGYLVAAGTPEEVTQVETSLTGQYLKPYLK